MSDYVTLVDEIGKYLENEEGKMKKNIFVNFMKVILCLSIIETIIIYVWNYFRDSYIIISYIRLISMVIINILLLILIIKNKKLNKIIIGIIILIYLSVSMLIPAYKKLIVGAPEKQYKYLIVCLELKDIYYKNAYGIDITELIEE